MLIKSETWLFSKNNNMKEKIIKLIAECKFNGLSFKSNIAVFFFIKNEKIKETDNNVAKKNLGVFPSKVASIAPKGIEHIIVKTPSLK